MTELSTRAVDGDGAGTLEITVTDGYHGTVDQPTIDEWELRQARIALSLLKDALRGDAMVELLAPYVAASDERGRWLAAESNGEWAPVESVVEVRGLRMEQFFAWFHPHFADEPTMLAANPDHYEVRFPEGIITEVLGGIPTRFQVQLQAGPIARPASFEPDPDFPIHPKIAGVDMGDGAMLSTLLDGSTPAVLTPTMQLRETDDGFAIKLTLYFPAAAPPEMLEDHSRHYAIEFSRWITMAYEAQRSDSTAAPSA
jgi:hypothetical protein